MKGPSNKSISIKGLVYDRENELFKEYILQK
jgi:hypothetical protein